MRSILTSLHGRRFGLDAQGRLVGNGELMREADHRKTVMLFDDFLGDAPLANWNEREGSDSSTSGSAVLAGAAGGVLRLTSGDSSTVTMAGNGIQVESALNWKANQGNLVFEARVKLVTITLCSWFLGFTDQVAALESPIESAASANTITTNATDAVGVFFDTRMTTDNWWFAGVKNGTDATHQDVGVAPVADTYETFRIEVTPAGDASLFRNGARVGTVMTGAVTATVALTPVFCGFSLDSGTSKVMDVDYCLVAADRA